MLAPTAKRVAHRDSCARTLRFQGIRQSEAADIHRFRQRSVLLTNAPTQPNPAGLVMVAHGRSSNTPQLSWPDMGDRPQRRARAPVRMTERCTHLGAPTPPPKLREEWRRHHNKARTVFLVPGLGSLPCGKPCEPVATEISCRAAAADQVPWYPPTPGRGATQKGGRTQHKRRPGRRERGLSHEGEATQKMSQLMLQKRNRCGPGGAKSRR